MMIRSSLVLSLLFIAAACGGPAAPATSSGSTDGGSNGTTGSQNDAGFETGAPDSPPQCTSMKQWTRGDRGSTQMHPGRACIDCHSSGEGPLFSAAGTVFPSTHEPDDCYGSSAITVTITDAAGNTLTATSNSAGNFSFYDNIQFPISAEVTANGKTRKMLTKQMTGDCNSCHTQDGSQAAPGRIVAP